MYNLNFNIDDFAIPVMESHHLEYIDYLQKASQQWKNATGNCDFTGSKAANSSNYPSINPKYKMRIIAKSSGGINYEGNKASLSNYQCILYFYKL